MIPEFLTALPIPSALSLPPLTFRPSSPAVTTFFPFLLSSASGNPRDFPGFPETTDSEKSPSTSIARRDVECVNTGVRWGTREGRRETYGSLRDQSRREILSSVFLKFPISETPLRLCISKFIHDPRHKFFRSRFAEIIRFTNKGG